MKTKTLLQNFVNDDNVVTQATASPILRLLSKRIFPGFKIGEAAAWLLFHLSWPALMASIYFITGRFDDPQFMSFSKYTNVQVVLVTSKSFWIAVCWWLYFIKLRHVPLSKKLALHLVTGPLFAALCIGVVYIGLTKWVHKPYPSNAMLLDVYNLLLFYCSHFGLFHAYNFWLSIFRQQIKEQELRSLAFQTEIKALKAQIEPHFLFNTLNSISASVPPDQEKTRMMIADLADTFRFALKASETEAITLEEEIRFIKTWLALEKYRLKEKLQVSYNIDSRCLQAKVPPMLLQPIVENALNHGIAPKITGGAVHIECTLEEKFIAIRISDTGVGYKGNLEDLLHKGIGLRNISKRLHLLYGQTLQVERNNNEGLVVSFRIPLNDDKVDSSVFNAPFAATSTKIAPVYRPY